MLQDLTTSHHADMSGGQDRLLIHSARQADKWSGQRHGRCKLHHAAPGFRAPKPTTERWGYLYNQFTATRLRLIIPDRDHH